MHTQRGLVCVRSDKVTEAFPYFVAGLIWFSDCGSGSRSIGVCGFRMLKYLFPSERCLQRLLTLIKRARLLRDALDIINKGIRITNCTLICFNNLYLHLSKEIYYTFLLLPKPSSEMPLERVDFSPNQLFTFSNVERFH